MLEVPRESVFRALTDPAALATWWGPAGFTTQVLELDLGVGGRYRFAMRPSDGDLFHLTGEFIEVDPPRRLAYSFRWEEPAPDDQDTVVRLTLEAPAHGGTGLSLRQGEFATGARLALHEKGWTESLVKLRRLLGSRT